MAPRILVTGASGNVGTEVAHGLHAQGIAFRVGALHPRRAQGLFGEQIDITHFDFLSPATYQATFAGIDQLFLVRPPALANVQRDIAPALRAAIEAGVSHIVFLSLQGVEKNRIVPHHAIEQLILASGAEYGKPMLNRGHEHHRSMRPWRAVERRPRCVGGCQRGGGTRWCSRSLIVQRCVVIPAAIAGVRRVPSFAVRLA